MNLQEKGERGLGQSSPLSSFYAIVPIDILHGAVCSFLMILITCAVDDAHGIFSKGGKKVLAVIQPLHCCKYPDISENSVNMLLASFQGGILRNLPAGNFEKIPY